MKLKYVIEALGSVFDWNHGFSFEIPFGKVRGLIYKEWQNLQAEFLATGIDIYRMQIPGEPILCSIELKVLGNILRLDNKDFFSFLNVYTYVKTLADFQEEDED